MRQFLKFTVASCLGVFIAMGILFFVLFSVAISATFQSKPQVKTGSVLKIAPGYAMPERTNNVQPTSFSLEMNDIIGVQDLCRLIDHAKTDDNIQGILLEPSSMHLGLANAREVMRSLKDFKTSGKFILAYANFYEQLPYYLASAADSIILNPIGVVDFRGFASFTPFYKELLDKTGIKMQIYYAGEYKSATEPFRRMDMSPESKLQTREYMDDAYSEYLEDIAANRDMSKEALWEIANGHLAGNSSKSLETGLVDVVGYSDEALSIIRSWTGVDEEKDVNLVDFNEYYLSASLDKGSGSDKIAVVYAEGTIAHGGEDVYGAVTDKAYVELLRDIRKNDKVKAVVLRVNSPGGSILAADNILREIKLLQETGKPLVVSMSDYAASGGYYISCTADSIFVEENTLTGSIGVFSMLPNPTELLNDKLGVAFDTVRTGAYSASFSPFFEWSDAEHQFMQARTDEFYRLFLEHVSNGRDMSVDEVDQIARGRIWSGTDAVSNGLADGIGTLEHAIESAATLADISEYRLTEYPYVKDPWTKMLSDLLGEDLQARVDRYVNSRVSEHVPGYDELKEMLSAREPLARLPVVIKF